MAKRTKTGSLQKPSTVKPRRRTHAERRETTRRQLLEATIECLPELGFGGATLEIIAKRAGASRGALQFHFGNRDDLFLALLDEIKARLSTTTHLEISSSHSFSERLAVVFDHYWDILNSDHYIAAVHVQIGAMHDPRLYPRVSQIMRDTKVTLDRRWVKLFAGFNIPVDRLVTARHVALSAMRGMVIRQIIRRSRLPSQKERAMLLDMLNQILKP